MTDPTDIDFETQDRRYTLAVNLECWELLAMHSVANDEVRHLLSPSQTQILTCVHSPSRASVYRC